MNLSIEKIPIAGPSITEKEIAYVTDAVENNWYENANTYIDKFEAEFAQYLGRKYAISLPSCTSAIHLSLLALNIGPGDEVIVPDATWIASSAPISYVGATPVFADINLETWCIDSDSVKQLITNKTKAIIAVNLYGHMPEYDKLLELDIPIIEDAAESIGSKYLNKNAGTFGATSCFSFHGSKTITTGEGGMFVTDDEKIYNRVMILRDHGRHPGDILFQNFEIGYKYKMSNLQAALGLAQLERINDLVNIKRQIYSWYKDSFLELDDVQLNPCHNNTYNSYWMTTAIFKEHELTKQEIINYLKVHKISSRPFFSPLSSLAAYTDHEDTKRAQKTNTNSYALSNKAINLPSAACVTREMVAYIKKTIKNMCNEKNKSARFN